MGIISFFVRVGVIRGEISHPGPVPSPKKHRGGCKSGAQQPPSLGEGLRSDPYKVTPQTKPSA